MRADATRKQSKAKATVSITVDLPADDMNLLTRLAEISGKT